MKPNRKARDLLIMQDLQRELRALKRTVKKQETEISSLQSSNAALQSSNITLTNDNANIQATNADLLRNNADLLRNNATLLTANQALNQDNNYKKFELDIAMSLVEGLGEKRGKLENQVRKLTNKCQDLKSECKSLEAKEFLSRVRCAMLLPDSEYVGKTWGEMFQKFERKDWPGWHRVIDIAHQNRLYDLPPDFKIESDVEDDN